MNTRLIIFGIVFLVMYNGMVSSMPYQFLDPGTSHSDFNIPDVFAGIGVDDYGEGITFTINGTGWTERGGFLFYFFALGQSSFQCVTTPTFEYVKVAKINTFFSLPFSAEDLTFTSRGGSDRGISLYPMELDADVGVSETFLKYHAALPSDPAIGGDVYFGFNTSTHNLPSDALREGELEFFMGLGVTEEYLNLNPLTVLILILTLQLPNIPPLFLFVINAPTYIILVVIVLDVLMEMKRV